MTTDHGALVKRLQHASTVLKVSPRAADLQAVSYIIDDAIAALTAECERLRDALVLCYDHCRLYHPEVVTNNVGEAVRAALCAARKEDK